MTSLKPPHGNPKRILAATDFSRASEAALLAGHAVAKRYGARLAVSHIAPGAGAIHPAFPSMAARELVALSDVESRATAAVVSYTKAILGLGEGAVDVLISTTSGSNEAAAIIEQAKDYSADLVVVGSHGRTGLTRALLGTVAERVVRNARCDVLVARAEKEGKPGPVVAAVDFSDASQLVLQAAAREAFARDVQLVAVFALDAPDDPLPYGMLGPFGIFMNAPDPEGHKALRETAERTLAAALAAADVQASLVVVDGRARQEIVNVAETNGASLVVLATHGRSGLARLALGSVAESVVRHASCSVMVVRGGEA